MFKYTGDWKSLILPDNMSLANKDATNKLHLIMKPIKEVEIGRMSIQ